MATHNMVVDLNGMCVVNIKIVDGNFTEGTYTNKYPFPLNFQVVDLSPVKGDKFFYTIVLRPLVTDEPLPGRVGVNVESCYAKITLARN